MHRLQLRYGFLIAALLFSMVIHASAASAAGNTTNRLSGADRFQVAVTIAEKVGWGNSGTVFLANYLAFADALSATPYAYQQKAPILLTEADKLTQATKEEIDKLNPTRIVIIGGPVSVSSQVVDELQKMGIAPENITRIGGEDRFAVAQNIAKQMGDYQKAIVANGLKFPDSLTIAPYAARNGYPILLTLADKVPQATMDALKGHGSPLVIGGPNSVSDSVLSQIHAEQRIGGADRFEVAKNIIMTLGLPTDHVYVATGLKFADALTGSVLAAKENAPLLLTLPNQIPDPVRSITTEKNISTFTVLGGPASVSEFVASVLGVTVVVDPGHGGWDYGATLDDNRIVEKNINLAVSKNIRDYLVGHGVEVVMTRVEDGKLINGFDLNRDYDQSAELQARVDIGENANGDVFVSIHSNSFENTDVQGTETYYHIESQQNEQSRQLAEAIHTRLVNMANMVSHGAGVKDDPGSLGFHVLRENSLPSVLTELGFITNEEDAAKLTSKEWQKTAGQAIALGILDYFEQIRN